MTAEEYIHQSIVEPNAYLAPECPNTSCLPGIMPQNFATRLSAEQIDTMVAFLLAQQGPAPTPVPIGGELAAATAAPKAVGAGKVAPLPAATTLPSATIGIILIVLVAAVSLVLIWKNRS